MDEMAGIGRIEMIAILDYDAGNMRSVEKAVTFLGQQAVMTRDRDEIMACDRVILPGVGSFGDAMGRLREYGMEQVIQDVIESGVPFLGICLGLQLLYESSEESPGVTGLGVLKGTIRRIPDREGLKIPHMGWNSLQVREGARLFRGLPGQPYVYFVHSYYLKAENEEEVAATTEYGVRIHASVERDNVFACQFHPEKSGKTGLQILRNFLSMDSPQGGVL